jgi:hypothetical protein
MPKYNNSFKSPTYLEETILDDSGATVGTVRLKPSSVLWKPANAQKFFSIPLDEFVTWISTPSTGATKTKS